MAIGIISHYWLVVIGYGHSVTPLLRYAPAIIIGHYGYCWRHRALILNIVITRVIGWSLILLAVGHCHYWLLAITLSLRLR